MQPCSRTAVVTIGLGTITYNPDAVILVCAAGEAKAKVVANAIQEPANVQYPCSALHACRNAVFFITKGAAKNLDERTITDIHHGKITMQLTEKVFVNLACKVHKRLVDLTEQDVAQCRVATALREKIVAEGGNLQKSANAVAQLLMDKIHRGIRNYTHTKFMHTEPHHDDIMLGYLPLVTRSTREITNEHEFICCTSGFNSVSNIFLKEQLDRAERYLNTNSFKRLANQGYFKDKSCKQRDIWQFLDGIAAADSLEADKGIARRFIRNLAENYHVDVQEDGEDVRHRLNLLNAYLEGQYDGAKDTSDVAILKGMCREWEAECLWGHLGWNVKFERRISHFYFKILDFSLQVNF